MTPRKEFISRSVGTVTRDSESRYTTTTDSAATKTPSTCPKCKSASQVTTPSPDTPWASRIPRPVASPARRLNSSASVDSLACEIMNKPNTKLKDKVK